MILRTLVVTSLSLLAWLAHAQESDTHTWITGVDLGLVHPSTPLDSWVDGGLGKLHYGAGSEGFAASRWFGQYTGRIAEAWTAHVAADVLDDVSRGFDLDEAYLLWRPIPRSANRQQWKLGFFQGPWSLENTEPGWTTPYTLSSSALNAWIGEELRPLGAEWSMRRRLSQLGARQEIGLHAAAFVHNDPAGSLLVWKGWSVHDRQSRLGDELPLAPLPQLQPNGMFPLQDPYVAPWREIDGRVGYYFGADWRYARRALVAVSAYDNRADPMQIEDGQYAWHTRFAHVGAQVELPGGVGFLAQWMRGTTVMGPVLVTARAVDTDFDAYYLLASKRIAKHRFSIRYDDFAVLDNDLVPNDDNTDDGHAWTLAYRFDVSARWVVGAEWLEVSSMHPAREYLGDAAAATERLLQVRISLRLGSNLRSG